MIPSIEASDDVTLMAGTARGPSASPSTSTPHASAIAAPNAPHTTRVRREMRAA